MSAVLWLEQNGIKIETLSTNLAKCPKTTIFMLTFAGLPAEKFRNKITFEDFIKDLSDDEQLNILKKMDTLLTAFYKDLALKIEKVKKANIKNNLDKQKDFVDVKKKLFELVKYVCYK